ncbi:cyclic pyranopterin monophosphate synthase subunit MoaA [Syntrophus gentianae]|uniref:GTP 3',8-cyclase n=1 Tax=Syntrophus gentianae TaxID=43775 RepID=A0A1H7V5X5_9BACT|nr:GTP 3',8-cyclase MoaA [Syntrophus gentianae]SEM04107.1 cyclic pyranopterin monophosphate synthase subunit MoaA [Syntrophus gentianae]
MNAKQETPLLDRHHRTINYLRLSITDRCNLRCVYCMPEEGISFLPHKEILTYEEMLRLVELCVANGIRKIRLTGGEPLVRKGVIGFIEKLNKIEKLKEITLTTNGVLLKEFARDLRKSGICRINVSMDTLKPEKFNAITRRPLFERVWEGIEEAESVGMAPIKLNVVAMKGFNDDEILDFARLTHRKPYHVRFIEMMPIGAADARMKGFISRQEILERISSLGSLHRLEPELMAGPAEVYALEGAKGKIGVIGALSHHFCATCNRLRLTADGQLRGCLFSDKETDLKTALRQGKDDGYLSDLIRDTILNKPKGHNLDLNNPRKCVRPMSRIGG